MGSWSHYLAREPTASFGLHWCLFTVNLFPLGQAHRQPSQHHINLIYGLIAAQNITIPLGGGLSLPHAAGRKRTGGWRRLKPFSRIKIGCLLPVALKTRRKKTNTPEKSEKYYGNGILSTSQEVHTVESSRHEYYLRNIIYAILTWKPPNNTHNIHTCISAISALCHVTMWTPSS